MNAIDRIDESTIIHPHAFQGATANEEEGEERTASQEAYDSVMDSGWAVRMAKLAYKLLYAHGPITRGELNQMVHDYLGKRSLGNNDSTSLRRLSELVNAGVVKIIGKKFCSVKGKKTNSYDVTATICPPRKPSTISRRQLIAENLMLRSMVSGLRAEVEEMRASARRFSKVEQLDLFCPPGGKHR